MGGAIAINRGRNETSKRLAHLHQLDEECGAFRSGRDPMPPADPLSNERPGSAGGRGAGNL